MKLEYLQDSTVFKISWNNQSRFLSDIDPRTVPQTSLEFRYSRQWRNVATALERIRMRASKPWLARLPPCLVAPLLFRPARRLLPPSPPPLTPAISARFAYAVGRSPLRDSVASVTAAEGSRHLQRRHSKQRRYAAPPLPPTPIGRDLSRKPRGSRWPA